MTSLSSMGAKALSDGVRQRQFSAAEVAEHFLAKARSSDSAVRAFLHLDDHGATQRAAHIDREIAAGRTHGKLLGVPVALKDNLSTADQPTTCGSRILEGYRPVYHATVVQRLLDEGAVLLGKTNLDEFAMGASTENSGFFSTTNPHNNDRVPGGSSGRSAAAVAAGFAPLALGSDTGGSVRQPASFCGVVGMRPTYGSVSRFGLIAFASSLDQIGPIAHSVEDTALLLRAIEGHDSRDSTSRPRGLEASASPRRSLRGLRIGLPAQYESDAVADDVRRCLAQARARLEELGGVFTPVSLPLTQHAIATYYLVVTSEASSNLARFEGIRYGPRAAADNLLDVYSKTRGEKFGDEVKRRILLGTFALSAGYYDAYYKKALQVRRKITEEFREAFQHVDVLLGPTAPSTAFRLGEKSADPLQLYLCDVFTAPSALAGLPAVSIPAGLDRDRLPIGLQLIGPAGSDLDLLNVAGLVEQSLEAPRGPVESLHGA